MAFVTVSGEPGSRDVALARAVAERLEWELVSEPDHAVVSCPGAGRFSGDLQRTLRVHVVAPERIRLDNLMQDCHLSRAEAKVRLRKLESERAMIRKRRCGQKISRPTDFDLVLNAEKLGLADMVDLVESAVTSQGLLDAGTLAAPESDIGTEALGHQFGHPSEQVFANVLDFYGIAWDYEPRSFPLQWDKDGKVSEAFTPDFYLPEFDLYVELTTMKQANVTRKNRKIRLLRSIYPHVNIQVFYQKDVQDLVMKYGLPERLAQ
jgi:cytidylate kinase